MVCSNLLFDLFGDINESFFDKCEKLDVIFYVVGGVFVVDLIVLLFSDFVKILLNFNVFFNKMKDEW